MPLLRNPEQPDDLRVVRPADDPVWDLRAQLLRPFLETPRTWSDLTTWASNHGLTTGQLQNTLAWMSLNKIAVCEISEPYLWSLVSMPEAERSESEPPGSCSTCSGYIRSVGKIFWCALCGRPV